MNAAQGEATGDTASGLRAMPLGRRTRELLRRYGLRPTKSLGQNFLVDDNLARKIAGAALELDPELVIEIGAGLGALTVPLVEAGVPVIAYEKDPKLEAPLRQALQGLAGWEVRMGDFLEVTGERGQVPGTAEGKGDAAQAEACDDNGDALRRRQIASLRTVAVGNLPYYITTPILERLFCWQPPLSGIVVTVQKEVAQRMTAQPGTKEYGSLTVFCRYYMESIRTIARLGPGVFLPPPEVESCALQMVPRATPPEGVRDERAFFAGVRAAFGYRRKALRRALATVPELGLEVGSAETLLERAGIESGRRGETLSFEEFVRLGNALHEAECATCRK